MSENLNPQSPKEPKVEYNEHNSILQEDVMIALIRTKEGPAIVIHLRDRKEMIMAKGEIDAFLNRLIITRDLAAEKERRISVIPAKGGIINAVRNRIVGR